MAANCQNDTAELLVPIFDARRENVFVGVYQNKAGKLVEVLPDPTSLSRRIMRIFKG